MLRLKKKIWEMKYYQMIYLLFINQIFNYDFLYFTYYNLKLFSTLTN